VASEIETCFQLKARDTNDIQPSQLASLLNPWYKNLEFEGEEIKKTFKMLCGRSSRRSRMGRKQI